jgi:calcium-dependent protein kinase
VRTSSLIIANKNDIHKVYKFGRELGKGSYGSVYTGVNAKTGQTRAIKSIKKIVESPKLREKFFHEVNCLRKMDHPNIIKIFEVFEDAEYFYLVTELC